MPKLTIDDKHVEVPDGATILDAAEKLGIEIPSLCFLKGYEPSTSCLVCVVKNQQTGQYIPACATRAVEGMQIDNATDEVSGMRRMALELLLSDHVGDCLAPCFFACPAHMDIPLMLQQIGQQNVREAIKTIKQDIALPAVLGRVCPKPCEKGCRRKGADDPVAVCELKRYVADADLDKRRSVSTGLPTGDGKADRRGRRRAHGAGRCLLPAPPGARLCPVREKIASGRAVAARDNSRRTATRRTGAEINKSCGWGSRRDWETPISDQAALDQLRGQFDAVLLACGNVEPQQVEAWGLTPARRGIEFDRNTYQTERTGVFAAGNVVRGKALVVRSTADGKEVAQTIDQYVSGREVRGPSRPFSSRMHKVTEDEMAEFLAGAGSACRSTPKRVKTISESSAADQADRCLACGCVAHGNCKLERYSIMYQADASRFNGQRRPYEVIGRHGSVLFEPGKCIKCELCVKIAASAGEPLGLSFVGRGFDVELRVPFDGQMDEALTKVAAQCVAPARLPRSHLARHQAVQLDDCRQQE